MKKVLFSLSLLASLATFAEETAIDATAQWTGVLPITTSAQNLIIGVPWVEQGYDDAEICVSNIIKTANLDVSDKIRVYNRTKGCFNVWELKDNEGVKYWDKVQNVGTNGVIDPGTGADITTLSRGTALILMRNTKPSASYTIYVIGQYKADTASAVTMVAGTKDAPAYTLVAPPTTAAYNIADLNWSGSTVVGAKDGDSIQVGETGAIYYLQTADYDFGKHSLSGTWKSAPQMKAGTGFWYVSKGGTPTISWAAK